MIRRTRRCTCLLKTRSRIAQEFLHFAQMEYHSTPAEKADTLKKQFSSVLTTKDGTNTPNLGLSPNSAASKITVTVSGVTKLLNIFSFTQGEWTRPDFHTTSMCWTIIGPTTRNPPLLRSFGANVGPTTVQRCWTNSGQMSARHQFQPLPNVGPTIAY